MGLHPEGRRSISPANTTRSRSSSPDRVSSEHADALPSPTATTSMIQERALTPPPFPPVGYASTGYEDGEPDELEPSSWRDRHPWLPRFALPVALFVGIAITAATTYALVAWVQRLQANASVNSDMTKWKTSARGTCHLHANSTSECRHNPSPEQSSGRR